jgi:hypothetical protein
MWKSIDMSIYDCQPSLHCSAFSSR